MPKDTTFNFLIYLSLTDKLGVVELMIWDEDKLTKDKVALPFGDWLRGEGSALGFNNPGK